MLANDYRPRKFAEVSGQNAARLILQSFVASGKCPPAFLFTGPSGTGKTTVSRVFASALNCDNSEKSDSCGVCDSCRAIQDGSSAAVVEVDAASNGGVDNIRALKDLAQYSSSYPWRVIILDEAHAMSSQAFNALLKVLEEPPSNTIFILLTTEPNKILKTVASRAMPIRFETITSKIIENRLSFIAEKEGIIVGESILKSISESSDGNLRNAIMTLEQGNISGLLDNDSDMSILTGKSFIPNQIANSLRTEILLNTRELVHLYFEQNSNPVPLVSGIIDSIQNFYIFNQITDIQLMSSMKLLWDARTVQSLSQDSRSQIDAMISLLHGVLQPIQQTPRKSILVVEESSTPTPSREDDTISSLEELVNLV